MLNYSLSEGFGEQLVNLTDFNLHGCVKLQELPESICNMRSLTKLDLSGESPYNGCGPMSIRALPERFGDLTSLEDLDMTACTSVVSLPESFCRLGSLKKLGLSGYYGQPMKLESLPERFGDLTSLKSLDIRSCPAGKNMPATLKEQLQAQGCKTHT